MGDERSAARGRLVRALIEECWSDQAGLDRMAGMLAPGYVHHTPWGDWDFSGKWPMDNVADSRILFQRPRGYGDRIWLTDEEHEKRVTNTGRSDSQYSPQDAGISTQAGSVGLAEWTQRSNFS